MLREATRALPLFFAIGALACGEGDPAEDEHQAVDCSGPSFFVEGTCGQPCTAEYYSDDGDLLFEYVWNSDGSLASRREAGLSGTTIHTFGTAGRHVRLITESVDGEPVSIISHTYESGRLVLTETDLNADGDPERYGEHVYQQDQIVFTYWFDARTELRVDSVAYEYQSSGVLDHFIGEERSCFLDYEIMGLGVPTRLASVRCHATGASTVDSTLVEFEHYACE